MAQNQAAWLQEKGQPLKVGPADIPKAGPDEVVIKNHAVAINPIDTYQAGFGFLVPRYPYILGHDVAGEVYEVGSNVSLFKKGDRVMGHAWHMVTNSPENGGFAIYTKIISRNVALLPSNISYSDAAVLPLGLDTAVAGLYQKEFLNLQWPSTSPSPTGQALVVYGGSSSIGLSTAQLAKASGVRVISIASPHNFDICKTSGASEVFDYKSAGLVSDVVAAIREDKLVGIYNAICSEGSWEHSFEILKHFGGGKIAASLEPPKDLPANVESAQFEGTGEFAFPLWENFVGKGLENGQIKALPPPLIVGKGLESIQAGLERYAAGVSAQKLVIEL